MADSVKIDLQIAGDAEAKLAAVEAVLKRIQREREDAKAERAGPTAQAELQGGRKADELRETARTARQRVADAQLDEANRAAAARKESDQRQKEYEKEQAERVKAEKDLVAKRHEVAKQRQDSVRHGVGIAAGGVRGGLTGAMGAAGGYAAIGAVAIEATGQLFEKIGKSAEILNNSFLTTSQRQRALAEEFLPLVGSIRKMMDGLNGITNQFAIQEMESKKFGAGLRVESEYGGQIRERKYAIAGAEARVRGMGAADYTPVGDYDRQTVGGQMAYEEEQMRRPGMDAMTRAQRRYAAARESRDAADVSKLGKQTEVDVAVKEYDLANQRYSALRRQSQKKSESDANRITKEHGGESMSALMWYHGVSQVQGLFGSAKSSITGAGGQEDLALNQAALEVQQKSAVLQQKILEYKEETNRSEQRGIELAEEASAIRKADIEVSKGELEILKSRESRMVGMSRNLGGMNPGSADQSFRDLMSIRQYGIQNVLPSQIESAKRIDPHWVGLQEQKFGEQRNFEYRKLSEQYYGVKPGDTSAPLGDFGRGQTIQDLQKGQQKIGAELQIKIDLDEKILAKEMANELGPRLAALLRYVDIQKAAVIQDIVTGAQKGAMGR